MGSQGNCPFCSSRESVFLLRAGDNLGISDEPFDLVKCPSCGVARLSPIPDEDESKKYYPDNYFAGRPRPDSPLNIRKKRILEKFVTQGKILDYGCGDLSFLLSLDEKWEKFGFDKKLYVNGEILAKNEIKFLSGSIFEADFPDGFFDVITFWASLEHTPNPKELLEFAYAKLKEGGKLIILLQNIDSIQSKMFKRYWFHLDLPRHLYHFSAGSLRMILKRLKFKVLKVIHNNPDYNIPGFTDSLRIFLSSRRKRIPSENIAKNDKNGKDLKAQQNEGILKAVARWLLRYSFAYPLALWEVVTRRGGIITIISEK